MAECGQLSLGVCSPISEDHDSTAIEEHPVTINMPWALSQVILLSL